MTTIPALPKTVWQLAKETGQPLETVIFQAVAYRAWQPGGVISAEWADPLSSILHGARPWHRPDTPVGAMGAGEPVVGVELIEAFAQRVQHALGSPVPVGDPQLAEAAMRVGLGQREGDAFTGHADQAACWDSLAKGELTLDDLAPERD